MPPISAGQTAFVGGEWSPFALSRTDRPNYGAACKTMRNVFPHPHGPASNRAGLPYVATVKDSTKKYRIYPFRFSVVQGYLLVFGHQNVRFIKDGGVITSSKAITGAADNGSGKIRITSATNGFSDGNTVTITGVQGTNEANGTWVITRIDANNYDLVGSTFSNAYISGGTGTAIVEIATPYAHTDLNLLKFEQSADVLYIRHPSYDRRKLTRTSHVDWTIATVVQTSTLATPINMTTSGGAGKSYVVTATLADGTESLPSASVISAATFTIGWDAVTSPAPDSYNVYQLVNGIPAYLGRTNTNSYLIDTTTPDQSISAPVQNNPFNGAGNWPGCCAFFQQRLYEGRTDNIPQGLEGSVVGQFENSSYSIPLKDDDSLSFQLDSREVNEIKWLLDADSLVIGTAGAEWLLSPGATGNAITQKNRLLKRQSGWGCSDVPPLVIGHDVLFVEGSRKKIRDLFYSIVVGGVNGGYDANDVTILAEHLFVTYGISSWAYQQHPDSIIWSIRDDGLALGLTFLKEHQIFGWHRHDTQGLFEDVAVVPNIDGTKDTYFLVNRDDVRMIEKLSPRNNDQQHDVTDDNFLDSSISRDWAITATLAFSGDPTVSGNSVTATAGSAKFTALDVGRQIHHRFKTYPEPQVLTDAPVVEDPLKIPIWHSAIAEITAYNSPTSVELMIINPFPDASTLASSSWGMTVTQLSGGSHLNGKSVVALADGGVMKDLTFVAGVITFPYPVCKVVVGLSYTCDLAIPNPDYPTRAGSVQDKMRSVPEVVLKLINTRSCWIGRDDQHLVEIPFRTVELANEPANLFNGTTKPIAISDGNDERSASVMIRVTDPLPITVQAIYPRIEDGQN